MFLPISAGDVVDNNELIEIFKCAPQTSSQKIYSHK
jgi:hypothetical protein